MTGQDPQYEPPTVDVMSTENGAAVTAAGSSGPTYGAITLMDDDGKKDAGG